MTKRNRNRKKHLKPAPEQPARSSSMRMPGVVVALILGVGALVFIHRLFFANPVNQEIIDSLSEINLRGAEPQVVAKIEQTKAAALEAPGSADAWGRLAMTLDAHDFKRQALQAYEHAAGVDPDDFRWPYFRAMVLHEIGSPDSTEWFERASKINSSYAPLWIRYGQTLFEQGNPKDAAEKFEKALEIDSSSSHARLGLAQISLQTGDVEEGRQHLEKALRANPDLAEAQHLLATIARQTDKQKNVKSPQSEAPTAIPDPVYADVVAQGESSLWYRYRGSEYMKQDAYDAAIQQYETAVKLRPDADSHGDLAASYSAAGKFEQAIEHYQAAIMNRPSAENYHGMALSYAKLQQYAQAEEAWERAIDAKSAFPEAHFNLAVLYARQGRYQDTIERLKEAIRIKPDYVEAHYHLGLAYLAVGDREAANAVYESLSELNQAAAGRLRSRIEGDRQ